MRKPITDEQRAAQNAYKKAWAAANPLSDEQKEAKRAYNRAWAKSNSVKMTEARKKWSKDNPETIKARNAAWYANNTENVKAQAKAWAAANPDKKAETSRKWKAANPEKIAEYSKEWRYNNRDKVNAKDARRRATKLQATPVWADEFIISEAYELAQLRTKATGVIHQVDHIVPLRSRKVCGLHCEFNLRVIPAIENLAKGNRHWPGMSC